jgi:hypothetical protein
MNYDEVVSLALSYADRKDDEVTSRMDGFLRIVESRANRVLQTQGMEVRSDLATIADTDYYTLPSDYNGMRDIELKDSIDSTSKQTMSYLNPEQMNQVASSSNVTGIYYTILAGQIQIAPIQEAGKVIEIIYYRNLLPLSDAQSENWLSIGNPDAYVFGLLVEISAFTKNAESKMLWDERFREALTEINTDDADSRWAGTPLQIRLG